MSSPPPPRNVRRLLRPTGDSRWTSTTQVAYGPEFVKGSERQWQQEVNEYARSVESARSCRRAGVDGTRTLRDTAIECTLRNIHRISLEAADCLPIFLVRNLWHEINKRSAFERVKWLWKLGF